MENNLVISLTTIPSRINKIEDCIKSLLNQSIPVKIELWIPKIGIRDGKKIEKIPPFLLNDNIIIYYIDDIGSISKIYFSLTKHLNDKDFIIISVDDDVKYPKNFVEKLLEYHKLYPNAALCYRGRKILNNNLDYNNIKLFKSNEITKIQEIDIITGTWGVLYKNNFFTKDFFNLEQDKILKLTDDIVISAHMKKNNIKSYVIPSKEEFIPIEAHKINALWELNKDGKNNNYTINYFKKLFL